jgi:hypothetical protein
MCGDIYISQRYRGNILWSFEELKKVCEEGVWFAYSALFFGGDCAVIVYDHFVHAEYT